MKSYEMFGSFIDLSLKHERQKVDLRVQVWCGVVESDWLVMDVVLLGEKSNGLIVARFLQPKVKIKENCVSYT